MSAPGEEASAAAFGVLVAPLISRGAAGAVVWVTAGLFTLLALDDRAGSAPDPAATTGAPTSSSDLAGRGSERVALHLAAADVDREAKALGARATRRAVMPELLGAFVRAEEPFTVVSPLVLEHLTTSVERSLADFERGQLAPRPR